ncbi:MAG: CoA transferase [Dehalococcoidia bacterium]|nr:CoA transferase [Dehalococcoidia bacterium]
MGGGNQKAPLSPYRVLDLTDEKGHLCGKIFADLGADVIKVEPPGGDPARLVPPFYGDAPDKERSLVWWAFNTGKQSATLDLEGSEGKEALLRLVSSADFLLESFSPGYLESLGLGYNALGHANPRLILTSITPFGQSGPYRDLKGTDLVTMALGGQMYNSGDPDRPPVRLSPPQAYLQGSIHAAACSLIAHHYRERTGRGQWLDVSIQAAIARFVMLEPLYWLYDNHLVKRTGNWVHRGGPPLKQIWPCKDGFIAFRVMGGRYGRNILPLVEWMRDEGVSDGLEELTWEGLDVPSLKNLEAVQATFGRFFLTRTKAELVEEAVRRRFMVLPVSDSRDILEDEHLKQRGFWQDIAHSEVGRNLLFPGVPYRFSRTPAQVKGRAPLLGEHSAQVLSSAFPTPPSRPAEVADTGPDDDRALEGVKLLDLTWQGAGPWATGCLADYGALVIRVESETALDILRVTPPYKDGVPGLNNAYLYGGSNSGKVSLALDLRHPRGREVVLRLVKWADVVAENFGPGTMERLGLGYDELRHVKPDIIMVSSCMFGHSGPRSSFVGFGPHLSGPAGFYHLSGWEDREPSIPHGFYTDVVAPWYTIIAIMAALDHRRRTGQGQRVEISQYEAGLTMLSASLLDYIANGRVWGRWGNDSMSAAPHGAYPCRGEDAWCAISVHTENEWQALCRAMGEPSWCRKARFATLADRMKSRRELYELVSAWTSQRSPREAMDTLQQAGVPAGAVWDARGLLEDPQLTHRGFYHYLEHPALGKALHWGWPGTLSLTPYRLRAGPTLGQDTEWVCQEVLGLSDEEFASLMGDGVLR